MKIALFSSEVVPFANTGGLGDVCGALPFALEKLGLKVVIIMPRFKSVERFKNNIKEMDEAVSTTTIGQNIPVFFLRNDLLFDREGLYGDKNGDYPDNLERFQFFCFKSLELLKKLNLSVDIVHCHDWQTCLIPAYLKFLYADDPFFKNMKSILTIHNMAYQGLFQASEFPKLQLEQRLFNADGFEFYEQINFLKGGIVFSDRVTTVSKTYAREIQTREFGCGLEGVLEKRTNPVAGILNGLDYERWNPAEDPFLSQRYSSFNIHDKTINKQQLQYDMKLPARKDCPLFGFVGRLSYQKGLDLLFQVMDDLLKMDLKMVFLGVGEEKYHTMLTDLTHRHPTKIAARLEFAEALAHRIYAGSDIFLMPSLFEPCGLSQMISLRYGTIPLVFKTGGLADTVVHYNADSGRGNGFVFDQYTPQSFLKAMEEAVAVFHDRSLFPQLVQKALTHDFSWDRSAREYMELYRNLLKGEQSLNGGIT